MCPSPRSSVLGTCAPKDSFPLILQFLSKYVLLGETPLVLTLVHPQLSVSIVYRREGNQLVCALLRYYL